MRQAVDTHTLNQEMAYTTPEITELLAKQDALNKQLAEAKERETRQVLIEIVQKMRQYGISLEELSGRKYGKEARQLRSRAGGCEVSGPENRCDVERTRPRAAMDRRKESR